MKYMGSKNRIAKHLIPIMIAEADSKGNIVFISEYEMPEQIEYNGKTYKFECIWRQEVKSSLSANGKAGGSKTSVEKLFKVVGV